MRLAVRIEEHYGRTRWNSCGDWSLVPRPAQPALSALELIKQRALTKKLSEGQIAASRIEAQEKLLGDH